MPALPSIAPGEKPARSSSTSALMFAAVLGGRARPFLPDGADSCAALMSSDSDAARAGCETIRAAAKTAQMGNAIQTAPTRVRIEEGADTGIEEAPTDIRAERLGWNLFHMEQCRFHTPSARYCVPVPAV